MNIRKYFEENSKENEPKELVSENDNNDKHKDTSRELNPTELNNNNNVMQLKENELAAGADVDKDIKKNNNFIAQQTLEEGNSNNVKISNTNVTQVERIITRQDYESLNPEDLVKYDKRSNLKFFTHIFIAEHSLMSVLFKKSLKEPIFIRFLKLIFSLSLQFFFIAVLITDADIDKRANNNVLVKLILAWYNRGNMESIWYKYFGCITILFYIILRISYNLHYSCQLGKA
jgi:membrane-associated HD superfamily phosphohydrolase